MATAINLLTYIQQHLKAPKAQFNSFGKYNYRNLEDILEAVKPLLADKNATLILHDDIVNIGDRNYVRATATLTSEDGTQWQASALACEAREKKGMDSAQITGATSSYARKYALNGLFCIDDTKDADNDRPTAPKLPPKKEILDNLHPSYPKAIQALETGKVTLDQILTKYEVPDDVQIYMESLT